MNVSLVKVMLKQQSMFFLSYNDIFFNINILFFIFYMICVIVYVLVFLFTLEI